ncbi:unnamed protein product [Mytilus coruscus]|uniref:Ig-like domain-containing protein n=1 Tax=Mytilus coruscus TaxID=42192 RepID=A0A6J8DNT9_MYTCO|nr:unnamed protein product [Mytilus coruscus]
MFLLAIYTKSLFKESEDFATSNFFGNIFCSLFINAGQHFEYHISTQIMEKQENTLSNLLLERNTTLLSMKQNCSISYWLSPNDLQYLIYLQSTNKPSTHFREGDKVVLTCTGKIGKPPGRLIWQKRSPHLERPIIYSNEITDIGLIPDVCSFRGTSNLTVLVSAEDLNAQFRCF